MLFRSLCQAAWKSARAKTWTLRYWKTSAFLQIIDGAYFSARSLKQDGFESELYDLGFSDWFYGNLLISDERFSFGQMFGNIILYKGSENITARSFETKLIRAYGSIDTYDLLTELTDRYGCKISEHMDVVYKSSRKPTAFRRWVLLNEVLGSSPVPRRARSAAFI